MTDNNVELSVRADLAKLLQELGAMNKQAAQVADNVRRMGDDLDKNIQRNTKKTEKHFETLRELGRRVADQLRGYFKSIADEASIVLKDVQKDLGLKQQFKEAAGAAIELHSVIQRIAPALGIAADRMSDFQQSVTDALSQFGQGNISKVLEGISQTQIRGEGNITDAARQALQLGTMTGNVGDAAELVKALSSASKARGGEGNNADELRAMAEMARHVYNVNGQAPAETLRRAQDVYGTMSAEDRRRLSPDALGRIMVGGGSGIDGLLKFLTDAKKLGSLVPRAQGFGRLFDEKGINFDVLRKVAAPTSKRIGFDSVSSLMTAGFGEEEARTLLRLIERSKGAEARQGRYGGEGGSLSTQARDARGLPQNQEAIKNQVQSGIGALFAPALDRLNKHAGFLAQTKGGSTLALGLEYGAAAAGLGVAGTLAKALGGKAGKAAGFAESGAKAALLEQATGQKTIPVWVVNFGELENAMVGANLISDAVGGGGGGKGGLMKGLGKAALQAGIVGLGAFAVDQILQMKESADAEIDRRIAEDEANPPTMNPPPNWRMSGKGVQNFDMGADVIVGEIRRTGREQRDEMREHRAQRTRETMHPGAPKDNRGVPNGAPKR